LINLLFVACHLDSGCFFISHIVICFDFDFVKFFHFPAFAVFAALPIGKACSRRYCWQHYRRTERFWHLFGHNVEVELIVAFWTYIAATSSILLGQAHSLSKL